MPIKWHSLNMTLKDVDNLTEPQKGRGSWHCFWSINIFNLQDLLWKSRLVKWFHFTWGHRGTNEASHRGRILELHLQDFTTIKLLRNTQFTSIHITWALDINWSKVIQKILTSHDLSHIRFTSLAVDPTCSSPSMPAIFKPRLAARFARLRVVSPSPKQPSAAAVVPQWYGRRRARCNWKHLQWIWFQGSKVQAGQNPQKSRWGLQKKPPTDED